MSIASYLMKSGRSCSGCHYGREVDGFTIYCMKTLDHIQDWGKAMDCSEYADKGQGEDIVEEKKPSCLGCIHFGPSELKKGFCQINHKMPGQSFHPVCASFLEVK